MSNQHPGWMIESQMARPYPYGWRKYKADKSRKVLEEELNGFAYKVDENLWKGGGSFGSEYRIVEATKEIEI